MDGKPLAVALVLCLILMVGSEGRALVRTEDKGFQCLCRSTQSKFIPPKAIQSARLNQRGPHCKNVEIIAALTGGSQVCLEPSVPWVCLTVKAILARARHNMESPIKEKSRKSRHWSFSRI